MKSCSEMYLMQVLDVLFETRVEVFLATVDQQLWIFSEQNFFNCIEILRKFKEYLGLVSSLAVVDPEVYSSV